MMMPCCVVTGSRRLVVLSAATTTRSFKSRAHPKPIPQFALGQAVQLILEDVEKRKAKRQEKWDRNAPKRLEKGFKDDGPYRNQDETIELALNLNLDPRKPGQALRGSLSLPHGSGKKVKCVVFTRDARAAQDALEAGALHAGGDEIVDRILDGSIPLDFDRALATPDMQGILGQKAARMLGPRGLMPNAKVGTLIQSPNDLVDALRTQLAGQVQYRTDKAGIIHLGVGKSSFGSERLLDNLRATLNEIYEVKPESFGKGKKKTSSSKNAKYFLRAHLTSQQGPSIRLDLRTVDPTSVFFMSDVVE